ncbi:DinI-like family protein [Pantoea sp. UBA6567]|uniref:DinI-like family protein n=1 Tax=Pantoea sp. UBA6567 TaxID=1947043 RepID=UPI0025964F96|nr:DinI-like family protein [Pantoea sp. UBA6567]
MRIEIMLDKNQKLSQSILSAFQDEVSRRVLALFPETIVRVRQGSYANIEMLGFNLDEDKRRLHVLLQNVWEDDSWMH